MVLKAGRIARDPIEAKHASHHAIAFNCDFEPPAHPELYFMQYWPDTLVKACRDLI